jgi:hypothetical protein
MTSEEIQAVFFQKKSNTSGKAGGLKTVNRSKRVYLFTT